MQMAIRSAIPIRWGCGVLQTFQAFRSQLWTLVRVWATPFCLGRAKEFATPLALMVALTSARMPMTTVSGRGLVPVLPQGLQAV